MEASAMPRAPISDLHHSGHHPRRRQEAGPRSDSILDYDKKPEMVVVRATRGAHRHRRRHGRLGRAVQEVGLAGRVPGQHRRPARHARHVFRNKSDPEFTNPAKTPMSVNLLGFPRESEMAPLVEFLGGLYYTCGSCRRSTSES